MKNQTLTSLERLKPGDVFCFESGPPQFIKIPGGPVKINKEYFSCLAVNLENMKQRPYNGKRDVVFIYKDKETLNKVKNWINSNV